MNTKVNGKTIAASGQGMRPVTNSGTCQTIHITPSTALATSAEWRRSNRGSAYPRQPGSSNAPVKGLTRKTSVAVMIDDQPASWAGEGGAAPSRTFTYATIAQPATGARNARTYQPTPTRHWISRRK